MQHAISRFISYLRVLKSELLIIFLVLVLCAGIMPAPAQADDGNTLLNSQYVTKVVDKDGRELYQMITPVKPPEIKVPAVDLPQNSTTGILTLGNVPAFDWSYGCSATSAAMMFGYYDRTGYANMYTGPTNGGVCPMDNSVWGHTVYPGVTCGECPINATHNGIDGRATRGHVDDYWIDYENAGPDPYLANGWAEHSPLDSAGDFMGTNQSKYSLVDGATRFSWYTSGAPLSDYTGGEPGSRDGCHGMRLFAESRSYTVLANYSQLIQGVGSNPALGFTFANYCSEIDAGRPVLIQVDGHTMLGDGYNTTGNLVYLHDTWDYSDHQMTWGGSYSGMAHYAVTVLQLAPTGAAGITIASPNGGENWNVGSSQNIAWTSASLSGNVKLELSRNGGSTYPETLAASVPVGAGSYPWAVTGPASSTCRVKVTSLSDPSLFAVSNSNFTVSILAALPWSMFRHDPQHSGRSPYTGPQTPVKKWEFATGNYVFSSPAIGSDGTVYVGSADNKLYAISADGSKKWEFATGDSVHSSPAIGSDGTVYVGSYDNKLYALNPNGSKKWEFATGGGVWSSPAIGSDSTVYVGSDDNKLYALNPNGSKKWEFATGGYVESSPAIGSDGTVYVGGNYTLYALNPDGSKKWEFATGDWVWSSPAIGSDGTVYVGSWDNKLYAIGESSTASLTLNSPNGGESWGAGSIHAITWTSANLSGNVKIELSRIGGSSYPETIASSVAVSAGYLIWTVSGPASTTCRVKVTRL
ncbi:MAG: PQQ-binding-like beta-propeller repeat protein, partial [Proteobacteria bacterium]|nr:PQQ-binding-like beta-propeller repeat protein [Pseudomonadota bacterium]